MLCYREVNGGAGAWLSMNNTLGQWGRDVADMVSDFGQSAMNWAGGEGFNTNTEVAINAAMKELGRQEAVAAALGAYEEFSRNYDIAVKGAMGEYDKMQAAYGAAAKEYDKMNEAINKAVNFINRDINVSHEEMKRLTESLNQGPNAGLEKEIEKAIKMFSQNKGLDADEIRRTACVAASLYADLQIAGANVEGSFAEFFANNVNNGNIRGKDAFITEDKQKNIVGQYEIGGNKAELQIIRDYDAFENLINSNDIRSGIVRITNYQNLNFSHNINIYNHDDDVYVSDVGTVRNHGKTYDEIIRRKNFEKFMFIKY